MNEEDMDAAPLSALRGDNDVIFHPLFRPLSAPAGPAGNAQRFDVNSKLLSLLSSLLLSLSRFFRSLPFFVGVINQVRLQNIVAL